MSEVASAIVVMIMLGVTLSLCAVALKAGQQS